MDVTSHRVTGERQQRWRRLPLPRTESSEVATAAMAPRPVARARAPHPGDEADNQHRYDDGAPPSRRRYLTLEHALTTLHSMPHGGLPRLTDSLCPPRSPTTSRRGDGMVVRLPEGVKDAGDHRRAPQATEV